MEMNMAKRKQEIYVSTDCEADGPIPGPYSLLSFASAAYTADKKLIGTFSRNLIQLPGAKMHPVQEKFWRDNPAAWAACRENPQDPEQAMKDYLVWLKALPGTPIFTGFPAAFDFMFVHWYLHKFAGESPFGHAALDIKSFLMAMVEKPFADVALTKLPRSWFDDLPHTHIAEDDAIEQGALFCNALAWSKKLGIAKQLLEIASK
jgi:hypothetical protein